MKFSILMIAAAVFVSGHAEAAPKRQKREEIRIERSGQTHGDGHYMSGCGLGSMVIQDSSKWSQVASAFLNGTGFQTFGITFGTSNCTEDGVASASREKDAFVEANLADIRRDISVGSGDYLSSLASLYGCKGDSQTVDFSRALRKHQDSLLNSAPDQASKAIDTAVASEKVSCRS